MRIVTKMATVGVALAVMASGPVAVAQESPIDPGSGAAIHIGSDFNEQGGGKSPAANYGQFDCPADLSASISESSMVGDDLGPGITEVIPQDSVDDVNLHLAGAGYNEIPQSAAFLRHLDTGEVLALDDRGEVLGSLGYLSANMNEGDSRNQAGAFGGGFILKLSELLALALVLG